MKRELESLEKEVFEAVSLKNIDTSFVNRNLEKYSPDAVISSLPTSPTKGTGGKDENHSDRDHSVPVAAHEMLKRRYRELFKQAKLIGGVFGVLKGKIEESKERVRLWEKILEQDRFEVVIHGAKLMFCKVGTEGTSNGDRSNGTERRSEVSGAGSQIRNTNNPEESAGKPLPSMKKAEKSHSRINPPQGLPASGSIDSDSLDPPATPGPNNVLLGPRKQDQTTSSPSNTIFSGSTLAPADETLPSSSTNDKGRHGFDLLSQVKVKEERRSSSPLGRLVHLDKDGKIVDENIRHLGDSPPTHSGDDHERVSRMPEGDQTSTEHNTKLPPPIDRQSTGTQSRQPSALAERGNPQRSASEEATTGDFVEKHPPMWASSLLPTKTKHTKANNQTNTTNFAPPSVTRPTPQKRRIACESSSVRKINSLADDGETYWRANKTAKLSPNSEANDDEDQNGENPKKNRLSDLLGGVDTPKPKPILMTPWSAPAQPSRLVGRPVKNEGIVRDNDNEPAMETPSKANPPTTRSVPEKACATKRQSLPAKLIKAAKDREENQPAGIVQIIENEETQFEDSCPVTRPEDEPFRARPLHHLDLSHFRLNPSRNQGLDHAFDEVVRRKAQRKCLPGCTRPDCCGEGFRRMAELKEIVSAAGDEFFTLEDIDEEDARALQEYLGPDRRNILEDLTADQRKDMLLDARTRDLANRFGKHRYVHPRAKSPPGFWDTDMPTTQEEGKRKEEAKRAERDKVAERHREALRPGGIWQFADE